MKKQNNDSFTNLILDEEEQLIEQALEKNEYEDAANFKNTQKMLQEAAAQYIELNKAKSITARVNQLDLIKFKARAKDKNIPYQTLLGVLIRDYVAGKTKVSL
jgi:predicted DNA binding CopG/RHH family protein